jgi:hypothetical protein
MIEHNVVQGEPAWFALRIGIPTASEFKKIITPAKAELSKQARGYAFKLVAETLLNRSLDDLEGLEWITRGRELEPTAVRAYEFAEGIKTRPVGFITTDDGKIGASPDRMLIGVAGGLEIKVPAPATHVGYLIDGFGDDYRPQVQGQMMVCELDFVDRYSYSPEMPFVRDRTPRDEPYIAKLAAALREFCDMKDTMLEKAKAAGWFAESPQVGTPADAAYGDLDELDRIMSSYAPYGNTIMAG